MRCTMRIYSTPRAAARTWAGCNSPTPQSPIIGDFIYFAWCLGMTFQTSDVSIATRPMRRAVTFHCLAAFVFNLGIIAFTINALGG